MFSGDFSYLFDGLWRHLWPIWRPCPYVEAALGETMPEDQAPPLDTFRAAELPEPEEMVTARRQALQEAKAYNEVAVGGCCRNEKLQQRLEAVVSHLALYLCLL